MTKRAVLYARVSGDDTGNDSRNIKGQLELCGEYADKNGYDVVAALHEDDRGASGAAFELPQLNAVRDMAREHVFDVLVVREIDRLSRNLAKQLIVEEELRRAGVTIEYVLGSYEDTPEGRLSKHVRATIAEYEREKISERTSRARYLKVRDGSVMMHGQRTFGYNLNRDEKKHRLEVNEEEARWVRQVFDWYTVGDEYGKPLSMREIVARLSDACVPTIQDTGPRQNKVRPRGQWSHGAIEDMLANETYTGTWYYGRNSKKHEPVAVPVLAIIDLDTFRAAQARRAENREVRRRAPKYDYLLAGRLRCSCGYAISPRTHKQRHGVALYYGCTAHASGDRARVSYCPQRERFAMPIDDLVWTWIKSLLTDPDRLRNGLREYQARRESENDPLRERLSTIDALLEENRTQLTKLLDLYLTGDFPREMLVDRKKRLQDTITKLEAERSRVQKQFKAQTFNEEDVEAVLQFVCKVSKGVAEADKSFAERRRIVDLLDVRAVFVRENGGEALDVECVIDKKRLSLLFNSSLIVG